MLITWKGLSIVCFPEGQGSEAPDDCSVNSGQFVLGLGFLNDVFCFHIGPRVPAFLRLCLAAGAPVPPSI